jgi:murein DD-endopeptidase MepM/ murein hydrolase activator NlpD
MKFVSVIISILCILTVSVGSASSVAAREDSLVSALSRAQFSLDSAAAQEQDILSKLDLQAASLSELEKRIRLIERTARALQDSVAHNSDKVRELEPRLVSLDSTRRSLKQQREPVARALAGTLLQERRLGKWAMWDFLLGSRNLAELFSRRSTVHRLRETTSRRLAQSNSLLDKVNIAEDNFLSEAARLDSARAAFSVSLSLLDSQRVELETARKSASFAQKGLRDQQERIQKDRTLLKEQLSQLSASLKQIDRIIARESSTEDAMGTIAGLRGKLPWPVLGKIVSKFGKSRNREFATVTENPGIDVACDADSPVRVVSAGTVRTVTWLRGFGNVCIVEHSGGVFSVYARLNEVLVKPETRIETQTTVGYPAFDAVTGGHEVHFEIWNGKEKQDPLTWLAQDN